jgi:TatA/E family protein of Tat protein translocase
MLGMSMTEVVIILGLALLLLGPDQLPTLARSLGKGLRELRKATDDIKGQFEQEMAKIDINETAQPRMIAPVPPPAPDAPAAPPLAAEAAPDDPAAARAAARRKASELRVVPAAGAVAREEK